ncbi:MAG: response regulator transcription factor [Anaerolineae bacterium]|nr:response regulator transcription factor [Anaerolineae bacterium]
MIVVIFGDDPDQLELHALASRQAGFQPVTTMSEKKLLSICAQEGPDLVIFDVTSKEKDPLPVIRKVRSESDVPIVVLSPQADEEYILQALESGVDDYLIKPHTPRMLIARTRTILRRTRSMPISALGPITIEGLTLDPEQHLVITSEGRRIHLTNLEFRLLYLLMRNPGRVIPSETIIDRVWGYSGEGDNTLLVNLMSRLRRKVEPEPANPRYIKTVPGIGYSFSPGQGGDTS